MVVGLKTFIRDHEIETRIINGKLHLIMYKAVRKDYGSWWNKDLYKKIDVGAYKPKTEVVCQRLNKDRNEDCGEGLHVGTKQFAFDFWTRYFILSHIVEVLVDAEDVVVPKDTDGKIRCKRLVVLRDYEV